MKLTENAERVLNKRYYGEGETWPKLCSRVASHVASSENDRNRWTEIFAVMMAGLDFLPNSPVLRNFGRNNGCGSACFVLPIEDSRRSIMTTLADAVDVQAFGGGTGFSFSRLRPKDTPVKSTGGASSGPVSFMGVYDYTVGNVIKQGGVRRGANMGTLRVDHPDIEEFISCKETEGRLTNFNISVGMTDVFMESVLSEKTFDLSFNGSVFKTIPPRKLWEKLVYNAWKNGEPGILFLDTINRSNPLKAMGEIEATNPCGEQPLLPYSSCTLGSVNLSNMVKGNWIKGEAVFDEKKLANTVANATRFLDDVVSANHYPVPRINEMTLKTRQIGIGVMGYADLCIKLKVRYGREDSITLAKKVMGIIYDTALKTSEELAKEKGPCPTMEKADVPRRNALLTSIAPTGTLSLIADCAGGCEPHFALNYQKGCLDGESLSMVPKVIREWISINGDDKPLPDYLVTAGQVSVDEHIAVQAAFQNGGVDSGVSKTINMPNEATVKDVSNAFFKAWKAGIKGMTIYRDGSREDQALTHSDSKKIRSIKNGLERGMLKYRPRVTAGPKLKVRTACGTLYIDTNFDGDSLIEIFQRTVTGGCEANAKALGVLASYTLRLGMPPKELIKALRKISCPACERALAKGNHQVEVRSCADGMARAMDVALENKTLFCKVAGEMTDLSVQRHFGENKRKTNYTKNPCPECETPMRPDAGCLLCPGCGYSKC
jgi:ribonucleoside-diphosphate reductase alpha chain